MTNGHQKCTVSISPSSTQTMRRILNVLIACEESQAECRAFRELGHKAFSCDIQPCLPSGNPDWHIQADVTPFLDGKTKFDIPDDALIESRMHLNRKQCLCVAIKLIKFWILGIWKNIIM